MRLLWHFGVALWIWADRKWCIINNTGSLHGRRSRVKTWRADHASGSSLVAATTSPRFGSNDLILSLLHVSHHCFSIVSLKSREFWSGQGKRNLKVSGFSHIVDYVGNVLNSIWHRWLLAYSSSYSSCWVAFAAIHSPQLGFQISKIGRSMRRGPVSPAPVCTDSMVRPPIRCSFWKEFKQPKNALLHNTQKTRVVKGLTPVCIIRIQQNSNCRDDGGASGFDWYCYSSVLHGFSRVQIQLEFIIKPITCCCLNFIY